MGPGSTLTHRTWQSLPQLAASHPPYSLGYAHHDRIRRQRYAGLFRKPYRKISNRQSHGFCVVLAFQEICNDFTVWNSGVPILLFWMVNQVAPLRDKTHFPRSLLRPSFVLCSWPDSPPRKVTPNCLLHGSKNSYRNIFLSLLTVNHGRNSCSPLEPGWTTEMVDSPTTKGWHGHVSLHLWKRDKASHLAKRAAIPLLIDGFHEMTGPKSFRAY